MRIVTNHWGWTPLGILRWVRYGWATPLDVWGVEITGSVPQTFTRRVKIGPVCFAWGLLAIALSACAPDWMDRSALSAVDAANLSTLHTTCAVDLIFPTAGSPALTAQSATCVDLTHRIMCHARIADKGECP